jgi:hypothetical protein
VHILEYIYLFLFASVKLSPGGGVIFQQLTRFKLRTIRVSQPVHHVDISGDAHLVQETKGTTSERCKAGTEDQSNVANNRVGNDTVLQAFCRFVDKPEAISNGQGERSTLSYDFLSIAISSHQRNPRA